MLQKVFITKYALTKGIIEVDAEIIKPYQTNDIEYAKLYTEHDGYTSFHMGIDAFRNKQEAITNAEERRKNKIESLSNEIIKLCNLTFK